ncbi:MAG: glycine cleavage system protein H [Omnitrophica WOR_2 bacterium GWA2_47_8]|nr:MAG: glycine cleavage system protein H [Omnitrophica WOR_2 bacterium GWA2_47_8]
MEVIDHYFYTKEHEWVSIEDNVATVGITEYAQSALGDITYIELPAVNEEVEQFEGLASIESVKAASDIYSPLSGKIVDINKDVETDPSLINKSCYEKGWIAKIEISDSEEKSNLMTAKEYRKLLESLEE